MPLIWWSDDDGGDDGDDDDDVDDDEDDDDYEYSNSHYKGTDQLETYRPIYIYIYSIYSHGDTVKYVYYSLEDKINWHQIFK